jgi:hypothetical protein
MRAFEEELSARRHRNWAKADSLERVRLLARWGLALRQLEQRPVVFVAGRYKCPDTGNIWRETAAGVWAWELDLLRTSGQRFLCPISGLAWLWLDKDAWIWETEAC